MNMRKKNVRYLGHILLGVETPYYCGEKVVGDKPLTPGENYIVTEDFIYNDMEVLKLKGYKSMYPKKLFQLL